MIEIAKKQRLQICSKEDKYIFLCEPNKELSSTVKVPKKNIPEDIQDENFLDVFVYKNSKNELIGSLKDPFIELGQITTLTVKSTNNIGAFLDWGLDKDLFLPFAEQLYPVTKGQKIIVALMIDKTNRPCATMKFKRFFKPNPPFFKDDIVDAIVYRINDELGAFVIIENQYEGLLLKNSYTDNLKVNDYIDARVTRVKSDGQVDLTRLPERSEQIDKDTKIIWATLGDNAGRLSLNDKSNPEDIKRELHMSKKAFKRAVGRLLKNNKIKITDDGIEML